MVYSGVIAILFVMSSCSDGCFGICDAQNITSNDNSLDCPEYISFGELLHGTLEHQSSAIEVTFRRTKYQLSKFLLFKNKVSVSLRAFQNTVHVICQENGGIVFDCVKIVNISNMVFVNCSTQFNGIRAAIVIQFSDCIYMFNITVKNSFGLDLYMLDVSHFIMIDSTQFIRDKDGFGKGDITKVYLDTSYVDGAIYQFHNCHFKNVVDNSTADCLDNSENSEMGSGLKIQMSNKTKNLQLELNLCNFELNCAEAGGGLHLTLMDTIQNNSVTVKNTVFNSNAARQNGGGVSVKYIQVDENMTNNAVHFINCNFTNNRAKHGGAVFVSSSLDYGSCKPQNYLEFEESTWTNNQATLGSAVYMAPHSSNVFLVGGSFLEPGFCNSYFENNTVLSESDPENVGENIKTFGKGTIYSNELNIEFCGTMTFLRNNGSALFLVSSIVTFNKCNATFESNEGYYGGSMAMLRNSAIHLKDHSYLLFDNNTATLYGGAIYHETYNDPSETGIYRCFIRYIGENVSNKMVKVEFKNNGIKNEARNNSLFLRGLSIFLYSLSPCSKTSSGNETVETILKNIANMVFWDYQSESEVSTLASRFTNVSNLTTTFIPGRETNLTIEVEDDTNTAVTQVTYHASLSDKSSIIDIDPAYEFVSNGIIKLVGSPHSSATLSILINYRPDYQLSLLVKLEDCPPGYVLVSGKCECSANTENQFYRGINRCNLSTFQAIIIQGYWAGYTNISDVESFRTSNCPFSFCSVSHMSESHLPLKKSELNLCSNGRQGKVCSLCSNNTTLFYHTQGNAHCGDMARCNIGALFYLLLEIIPVTIFFVIIIAFNVKLTSGNLCGFLLYAQIFDTLEVTAGNFITFPTLANHLLVFLKCLLGIFNLDFFLIPELSFCMFRNANYMHLLLFSYLTIFYALILIVLTVLAVNYRYKEFLMSRIGNKLFKNTSIIHGVSSFLVICYARTTKTSLQILNPVTLFGKNRQAEEKVVYYHGEYDYFGKEHLPFAILAIIALLLTCLPVLLLLIYPLCYQLLALLKLEESSFNKKICHLLPLEIFRPFFDSFQSTFKDNHRYFAGLFFLYRFAALVMNNASNTNTKLFFSLEIFFLLAVTLHGLIQPHKSHQHNQVDISIFALLAVLNGITSYNYHLSLVEVENSHTVKVLSTLQILLAYLPVLYFAALLLLKVRKKLPFREWCRKKFYHEEDFTSDKISGNAILELMDQHSVEDTLSSSYREL